MSDTYEVRFQLADGSLRTVLSYAKGPVTAERAARVELGRSRPEDAFTAKVLAVDVARPDPG